MDIFSWGVGENLFTRTEILYNNSYLLLLPYIFGYKAEFFSFQNNSKNLDPSYKTDLDLWDYLGRVKLVMIAKFHRDYLVICSHSGEGKTLSYSQINTVLTCTPCPSIATNMRGSWGVFFTMFRKILSCSAAFFFICYLK